MKWIYPDKELPAVPHEHEDEYKYSDEVLCYLRSDECEVCRYYIHSDGDNVFINTIDDMVVPLTCIICWSYIDKPNFNEM